MLNNLPSLLKCHRSTYLQCPQAERSLLSRRWQTQPFVDRCWIRSSRLMSTIRSSQQQPRQWKRVVLFSSVFFGGALYLDSSDPTSSRILHTFKAIHRVGQAGVVGLQVAVDYQWWYLSCRYNHDEEDLVEAKKRKCHLKSAKRVRDGLQRLGGIYVKLGQHISAMKYVLPIEWTSTMEVLQDRCDSTSTRQDLEHLFLTDYGLPLEQVFDVFDWDRPLGVASLAQVHKARLASTGEWVAVKLQHPRLDEFCKMDLDTVQAIVGCIKWVFPDFGFEWVLQEMQDALPLELDFVNEANNARQVDRNFHGGSEVDLALVIPRILWAQRRILCMEFIEGARPDDLDYMRSHHIDPIQVSSEITTIFSKMMFIHGFVHCDPHPGNILIRPNTARQKHGLNFDVVLLDHGQYRTLDHAMRLDYAHLWTSLIRGDEAGIELYANRLGCRQQSHRLFASLLTGREWHTIEAANLSSLKSTVEISRVSGRTGLFLHKIADILATLPRVMLLMLKTSDLLRHLDESLRPSSVSSRKNYALMIHDCARAVWLDAREKLWLRFGEPTTDRWWRWWSTWCCNYVHAWWEYHSLDWSLWLYE